jgi:hypothetical protein
VSVNTGNSKAEFLEEVLFSSAFSAAVQHSKTYSEGIVQHDKDRIRESLKKFLRAIRTSSPYLGGGVTDEVHGCNIENLANDVGRDWSEYLYDAKFRIGTAQKLLNLYLKLYWCIGEIAEPPHCPIDRFIIRALDSKYHNINWTTLDDLAEYQRLIDAVKGVAASGDNQLSIAAWELKNYPELAKPRKVRRSTQVGTLAVPTGT